MADILIRGLDDEVVKRLKQRADRDGRSLHAETKRILERAAGRTLGESLKSAHAWRKKLRQRATDSVKALAEDRRR
ncbi:MAG: hypothetical protein DCC68_23735 [Planctomycetota bacterium]|nr:MAG: hypothetical protein DCC68_23735 [Planctomycetota bacterium]